MTLCSCGCGEEVKVGNKYINHHNRKGKIFSKKSRKKMSEAAKGKHLSEATKKKISEAGKGHLVSEETRKKISEANKERVVSFKTRKKISKTLKGRKTKPCSKETKKKISKSNKGKTYSEVTRKKMSEAQKRRFFSKEGKRKNSESQKGKKLSEATKMKISESNKGRIPSPKSGFGKRSYYLSPYQNKVCFRSSWEKAYAQYLDNNNIDWLYECETFDLYDTTYTPDFYLIKSRGFVEIKGYMSEKAQKKIDAFRRMYPEEWLEVLFKKDLIEMGVLTKDAKPWSVSQHLATEEV